MPVFVYGTLSPKDIRKYDESPEVFHLSKQARPVELVHPDVTHNNIVHGFKSSDFMLAFHDLVHVEINSLAPFKKLARYLRNLIQEHTGYNMSKGIWNLSDMVGFTALTMMRSSLSLEKKDLQVISAEHLYSVINEGFESFWVNTANNDLNLLLIIDMILNQNKWQSFLPNHLSPVELFNRGSAGETWFSGMPLRNLINKFDEFQNVYLKMKKIIENSKVISVTHSIYLILKYRLSSHEQGNLLCDQLKDSLSEHFVWTCNSGLKSKSDNKLIKNKTPQVIFEMIKNSCQDEVCNNRIRLL
jgi:hypothetical protein